MSASEPLVCHRCGYRVGPSPSLVRCPTDGLWLVSESEHAKNPRDTLLGATIGRDYCVVGILGAGGMGAVYRAVQQPVGRSVALKVILPALQGEQQDRTALERRFLHEARAIAGLTHPNTVTLHDFGVEPDGTLFMVLEHVSGRPLSGVLRSAGRLDAAQACAVAAGVLEALAEAHALGIVHRDLKPDNIMLSETRWGTEALKVLDFGIAKVVSGGEGEMSRLTRTGTVFGTPHYMSPEQAVGEEVDGRADLYSLGVILYEMLSGALPYDGESAFSIMLQHRDAPLPDVPEDVGAPPEVEEIVRTALAKRADDRFGSAGEMQAALYASGLLPQRSPAHGLGAAIGAKEESLEAFADTAVVGRTSREWAGEVSAGGPGLLRRRVGLVVGVASGVVSLVTALLVWTLGIRSPEAPAPVVPTVETRVEPPPLAPPEPEERVAAAAALARSRAAQEAGDLDRALEAAREAGRLDPGWKEAALRVQALELALDAARRAARRAKPSRAEKRRAKRAPRRSVRATDAHEKRRRSTPETKDREVQRGIRAPEL